MKYFYPDYYFSKQFKKIVSVIMLIFSQIFFISNYADFNEETELMNEKKIHVLFKCKQRIRKYFAKKIILETSPSKSLIISMVMVGFHGNKRPAFFAYGEGLWCLKSKCAMEKKIYSSLQLY